MKTFAELFKKYRLKAEFVSLSELADAMAQKGYIYETSIFYHWQGGTRIPAKRDVIVNLIELFIEREGIASIGQANEFLESAGHGFLTDREQAKVYEKYTALF
jgi:hypothetical protein